MKNRPSDTARLKALVAIFDGGSSDFDEMLFHARRKRKTEVGAYRLALDQWIKERL